MTGDTRVATPSGSRARSTTIVPGAEPDSDTTIDLEVLDRLGRPVTRLEALPLRRPPDAAAARRARATSSPARTTIRCSASSTWSACRCCSGSSSRRSRPGDRVLIGAYAAGGEVELADARPRTALFSALSSSEGFVSASRAPVQQHRPRVLLGRRSPPTTRSSGAAVRLRAARSRRAARCSSSTSRISRPSLRARSPSWGACAATRSVMPGVRLARAAGVQARVPAVALHRRRLVVAAAAEDDPGLVLDATASSSRGRPAAAARVRRRSAGSAACEGRDQGRDHQPPRRPAASRATSASWAPSRRKLERELGADPAWRAAR